MKSKTPDNKETLSVMQRCDALINATKHLREESADIDDKLKWCYSCGEGCTTFCRGDKELCTLFPDTIVTVHKQ
jgi:hypothetical protein